MTNRPGDAALAAMLAQTAGDIARSIRGAKQLTGKALGDIGDATVDTFLTGALRRLRPEDAILCEESADSKARLDASRVWILDPIDGTREYSEGREDWAVHVALVVDGEPAAGAVALPDQGKVFRSDQPILSTAPMPDKPRFLVSRSRPGKEATRLAARMAGELIPMGSAGAKAMAVVSGDAEVYLHSGGQYEWDSCAPVAVAKASGLHCSRIDGSPLHYNQIDTYLPDLLICRPELAEDILCYIKDQPQ